MTTSPPENLGAAAEPLGLSPSLVADKLATEKLATENLATKKFVTDVLEALVWRLKPTPGAGGQGSQGTAAARPRLLKMKNQPTSL